MQKRSLSIAGHRTSIALEADAKHLVTDVWTSAGVVIGIGAAGLTGWLWLDAAVAIAVGFHILAEGWHLIRASAHGLMDAGLKKDDLAVVQATLNQLTTAEIGFSNLRTRRAGAQSFVYLDVRVPGQWTVAATHRQLDRIEREIAAALPETVVFTHAEPAAGA